MANTSKILAVVSRALVRCPMVFRWRHRSIMSVCWQMQKFTNANHGAIKMITQPQKQEIQQPKEQLQKLEQQEEKKQDDEGEPSFMINDYLLRFYGCALELEKDLPTDHIHIYFNISKNMPKHLKEYIKKLRNPNPVESVPNFEVVVKRGDWILSLYCGLKTEFFLNDSIDPNDFDIFEIKDISIFQHLWNEFTYTTNQYMVDHDLLLNIKKNLKNLGITNEFALKMSYLATGHADTTMDVILDDLIKFRFNGPKKST